MKKYILKLAFVFCTIPIFIACSNEDEIINNGQKEIPSALILTENDSTCIELSKLLAKSISDEDILKIVTDKVMEQIDGDYNSLFVDVMSTNIESGNLRSSGKTILDVLIENSEEESKNHPELRASSNGFQENIKTIQANNPLLQVAMPLLDEDFDGNMSKLNNSIVAYLPENLDEKIAQNFTGYDSSGKEVILNTKTTPNFPVVIISQNERLIPVPKSASSTCEERKLGARIVYSSSDTDYYLKDDLIGVGRAGNTGRSSTTATNIGDRGAIPGGGGRTPSGTINGTANAAAGTKDRDLNDYNDYLYKARFTSQSSMREFESWTRGRPEVRFTVFYYSKSGVQNISNYLGEKYWYNGNTRVFNIPILNWDPIENGKHMKYVWMEEDGGKDTSTDFSFSTTVDKTSTSVKTTIASKSNDRSICECIVSYDDKAMGEGTKYFGNLFFEFWINIQ